MHSLHSKAKGLKCIIISKFQSRSREGPFTFADNFLIGYNGYYCVFGSEMPLTALDFRGKYKLVRPEARPRVARALVLGGGVLARLCLASVG